MTTKRPFPSKHAAFTALLLGALTWVGMPQAHAAGEVKAVATFSILGDLVRQVGGERVDLTVLVGVGGDSHVFQPSPRQARDVGQAQVLFSNGLGYESWVQRLVKAANFKGRHVVASLGIEPLKATACSVTALSSCGARAGVLSRTGSAMLCSSAMNEILRT